MNILIGCEESGIVREAFTRLGHNAWSCDLLPSRIPGNHYQCDVRKVLNLGWDMAIFHTPCTYLSNSGIRWLYKGGRMVNGKDPERWEAMCRDAQLFLDCKNADIPYIAMENPRPHPYALEIMGKESQIIQPWMFGHLETKETWLWEKNLPQITETRNVYAEMMKLTKAQRSRIHYMTPGPDRQRNRSETYAGIADAFAEQWGSLWAVMPAERELLPLQA
jgi:hypothetical protein